MIAVESTLSTRTKNRRIAFLYIPLTLNQLMPIWHCFNLMRIICLPACWWASEASHLARRLQRAESYRWSEF
jgi:hypothetical protein